MTENEKNQCVTVAQSNLNLTEMLCQERAELNASKPQLIWTEATS